MAKKTYISKSPRETKDIAKKILRDNTDLKFILLKGEVGSGKTVFVKGIAEELGIKDEITSPTFGIKKIYDGLIHYDLYLSEGKVDLENIIDEDLEDNIVIVEWANKLPKKMIRNSFVVEIRILSEFTRQIIVG